VPKLRQGLPKFRSAVPKFGFAASKFVSAKAEFRSGVSDLRIPYLRDERGCPQARGSRPSAPLSRHQGERKHSAATILYHSVYFAYNSPIGSQQMRRVLFAVLLCVGLSGCAIPQSVEGLLLGGCRPYGMKGGSRDPEGGKLRPEPRLPPGCDGPFKPRPKSVPQP
jgi:hypothetical protein